MPQQPQPQESMGSGGGGGRPRLVISMPAPTRSSTSINSPGRPDMQSVPASAGYDAFKITSDRHLEFIKEMNNGSFYDACCSYSTYTLVRHAPSGRICVRKGCFLQQEDLDNRPLMKELTRALKRFAGLAPMYVLPVYGAFVFEGQLMIMHAYMDLGSIRNLINKLGPLKEEFAIRVAICICKGLIECDEYQLPLKEITPCTILVNSTGQIMLGNIGTPDTGAVCINRSEIYYHRLYYEAPEAIDGNGKSLLNTAAMWTVGMILIEIVTGKFAYDIDLDKTGVFDFFDACINGPVPTLDPSVNVSSDFRYLVEACLQKDPTTRIGRQGFLDSQYCQKILAEGLNLSAWTQELAKAYFT